MLKLQQKNHTLVGIVDFGWKGHSLGIKSRSGRLFGAQWGLNFGDGINHSDRDARTGGGRVPPGSSVLGDLGLLETWSLVDSFMEAKSLLSREVRGDVATFTGTLFERRKPAAQAGTSCSQKV